MPAQIALYLLPNAKAIRLVESGSLLHLLHKWTMRTCFNAQEEIYQASMEEVEQVRAALPALAGVGGGGSGGGMVSHTYNTYHISAIDTQSFAQAVDRNHLVIGAAAAQAVDKNAGIRREFGLQPDKAFKG